MQENEVTQISVKGNLVGIVGLQNVMEMMLADYGHKGDEEIGAEIVKRLAARNYIPDGARSYYAQAFAREFRKYMGQPVEEEKLTALRILVLGPGCAQCNRLEIDVREVMAQMNVPAEMVHVTDVREISKYGVLGLPALVINNKVVSVGTTPQRKDIQRWLTEAIRQMQTGTK